MGTIAARKKKDGSTSYTAQIRIRRSGAIVYQESQTFERRPAANAWLKKRETELAEPGALERAMRKGATVAEMIKRYLDEYERIRPLGRTKRMTLQAIAATWLGDVVDTDLTSQRLVEYAHWRRSPEGGGVKAQTIGNDLSHLGAVMSVARPAWNYQVDAHAMADARKVLRKMGMTARSTERDRRPELAELDALLEYYADKAKWRRQEIDMPRLICFAVFSTRRQDEICRIRWDDLDEQGERVMVRDMKNPGQKFGNDVWCHLPPEAMSIALSMPRVAPEIFPYNGKSVGSSFTKACKFLEIADLHFHDLRHDGVSRLFEMDWDIPRVASVSGHRDWNSLRRYTHLRGRGDKYAGWAWLPKVLAGEVVGVGG